ncbi:Sec-independent protein translocase protein TatB [Luteimonas vadosa]|uniref:Sec-independent protein translocase protein TatB n=1 Tax=Luteimonas vadosa TaxID=1165507 RepID=A0ABP9DTU8_9GAMM
MFDLGFTELLLVAVVALVVLGPQRLPKAARFAGLWVRRARAQWDSVRMELERELAAEELKRDLQASREALEGLGGDLRDTGERARREAEAMRDQARDAMTPIDQDGGPPAGGANPDSEPNPDPDEDDVDASIPRRKPADSEDDAGQR